MSELLQDIDRYLDNEMSNEEKIAFESKIDSDPELAMDLKLQQDMRSLFGEDDWVEEDKELLKFPKAKEVTSFLRSDEAVDVKNIITDVISENKSNSNSFSKAYLWMGIAASLLLLFGISQFFNTGASDYDQLYSQYIDVGSIPSLVTRGENDSALLQEAQLFFEDKDYEKALQSFIKHQKKSEVVNPLSYIYAGISYIELNQFDKALEQFDLLKKTDTLQSKKSDWYTAMVYLKQGEKKKLKQILTSITTNVSNYKYQEAKALLDAM